jgi:hypothetical protein
MKRYLQIIGCVLSWAAWVESQENLLRNADFEAEGPAGQAQAWAPSCTGGSTAGRTAAEPGAGAACGFVHKVVDGTSHVAALAQDVAVKGDTEYLLSGLVRGSANLFSYEYGENNTWIRCAPGVRGTSAGWQPVSVRFKTDPKAVRSQVRFEIYGTENQGDAWVDEIYFGPTVPPPGQAGAVTGAVQGDGSVLLQWAPPATGQPVEYLVYRSRFPDLTNSGSPAARVTVPAWRDAEARDWPRVYYQVAAVGAAHQTGTPSPVVQVSRPAPATLPAAVVWTRPVLEKVRRYTEPPAGRDPLELRVELARREVEWAQVLITAGKDLDGVTVTVAAPQRAGQPAPGCRTSLYRVGYTQVSRPTLPGARPGLYPDPLPPLSGPFAIPLDATQAIWVQVATDAECPAGEYESQVVVAVPGQPAANVPLHIRVFNFELPLAPSFMSAFALWGNFIERAHGVKAGSDDYRRLYETYYWFMVDHRLPPDDLPVAVTSPEAARFLDDPRVGSFRIPAGWNDVKVEDLKATAAHLREHGWLKKGYIYCYDEPAPEQYSRCRELAEQVHQAGKDVPFLLTEQPEEALFGAVDIWSPVLSEIKWDAVDARRAAGERLWWYTCCGPQAPYPTYLIDDCGASPRVLSWLQALHRIEGVLYWCVNVWTPYRDGRYQDDVRVWEEAEMFPNANGDGFLVYPGTPLGIAGPVSSVRLETIRDGNEDVEYVALLRRLLAARGVADAEARVRDILTPVARHFTDWNRDPETLQAQRRRLAAEIEALSR